MWLYSPRPFFPQRLPHCHLSLLVTSSPPYSHFRQGDEHHTERRSIERGGNRVLRTEEEKKKVKQAAFSQWASKSCHIRDARLRCSYALLSLLANSLAHIYTRYLTHSDTHLGCFSRLSSSVLSLNGFVSFHRCWITFSAAHCHCARNPLNSSPSLSLSLFLLCLSASLCLRLSAITLSSLRWPVIVGSPG